MRRIVYCFNAVALDSQIVKDFALRAMSEGHKVVFVFSGRCIPNDFPFKSVPQGASLEVIDTTRKRYQNIENRFFSTRAEDLRMWQNKGIFGSLVSDSFLQSFHPTASLIM